MSKAVYTAPLLAGIPTPSTAYVGSAVATGTTTTTGHLAKEIRAGLIQLPEPMLCSDIWAYVSIAMTVGGGSDSCAIRLYPAAADGSPIQGALPFQVIAGPSLASSGHKQFTPGSNIYLPQMFYATLVHNYVGGAGTIVSWQTTGTIRAMPQSALGATPGTSPISNMLYTWTEATYDTGATRTWGNEAVTLASAGCWFLFKKA